MAGMAFCLVMGQGNESVGDEAGEVHAGPSGSVGPIRSDGTRRPPVSMGNLLAASGFAAFAALVLAASIIFGLPGTEHAGGRGQVTGRISMVPPPLRH
jgi:hypothetical protein